MTTDYIAIIDTRIDGIPCQIGVENFSQCRGSYSYDAASDFDYYGFTDIDWDVLDRNGRIAPWLSRKLTDRARDDIEAQICREMADAS